MAGKMYTRVLESAMKTGSPVGDSAAIKGYKDPLISIRERAAVPAYYRLETFT